MGGAELRDRGGNSSRYFSGVREANGHAVKGPMAGPRDPSAERGLQPTAGGKTDLSPTTAERNFPQSARRTSVSEKTPEPADTFTVA